MTSKLALKELTASDLTFFEWQFRNRKAGNQKAINLNQDVFVERLYPSLPAIAIQHGGKIHIDLSLFGPGLHGEYNLARKIVKGGTYKNWRLNGEFIHNPDESPDRFNSLEPGDLVVLEFRGEVQPTGTRAFFISAKVAEDIGLHGRLSNLIGTRRMVSLAHQELASIVESTKPADEHPIHELLLDSALEDTALGGFEGTQKLLQRRSGRSLSLSDLLKAKEAATVIGQMGEELVNGHIAGLKAAGEVRSYEWSSQQNAVSPFDFKLEQNDGTSVLLDVKTTKAEFGRKVHISLSELRCAQSASERYDIYRVYEASSIGAKLRIARDVKPFAEKIFDKLTDLPSGVSIDGMSVDPKQLEFDEEIRMSPSEEDMENP